MLMPELRVVLDRPGRNPLELSPLPSTLHWVTAALGGFAECSFQVASDRRRDIPLLSLVRVLWGDEILYEGRVEDTRLELSDGAFATTVDCYGLRRRLEQTSVQRIWVKRDLTWNTIPGADLTSLLNGSGLTIQKSPTYLLIATGQYDASDLTKIGIRFQGNSSFGSTSTNGVGVELQGSASVVLQRLLGTFTFAGGNMGAGRCVAEIGSSTGGDNWTRTEYTASGSVNHQCVSGATRLRVCAVNNFTSSLNPTSSDTIDLSDVRLLGATTTEDASGGLYGGTILRDLIALIPELTIGEVEDGMDFLINQMDRFVRDSALSVVEEVSGYYAREWGVWESGRFDWVTRNLDEPQWMVTVADLSGLTLSSTVDSLVRTVYLSYVSAIDLSSNEVNASSTDARNPFVKRGQTKDAVIQAPFLMTPQTSQQLANVLARIQGAFPPIAGTITLPVSASISRNNYGKAPAYLIRGGDNILIGDLPKSDPLFQGRDGETLFHVTSSEISMEEGTIKLEVESADKRADLLMARLSAATRQVTG